MNDPQPSSNASPEVDALRRVVAACEQFEVEWRGGRAPRIESYLERVQPGERRKLFALLLAIEVEQRVQRGENPSSEQYRAQYPDRAQDLALVFPPGAVAPAGVEIGLAPTVAVAMAAPDLTEMGSSPSAPSGEPATVFFAGRDPSKDLTQVDPIPARFGRYSVTKLLGTGGFGTVYLARDEELGRSVAIKVPRPGLLRTAEQVESFMAEARVAAGLRHPTIVRVYDVGRCNENEVFVVFEFVEGRTLADLLETERLSPRRIAGLLVPIAEAAHYAHRAGLVHRDIKPANILIDDQEKPHIADFGLAIREDLQNTRTGEIAGTPIYMAPEQVRGETHRLDGRTDLWAVGVILYLGLVGRLPFSGRDHAEIFEEILHRDPKPPRQINDQIPRELERICLKSLSKRMADRHETAEDLALDLKSWLAAEASTHTIAPEPSRLASPVPPHTRIVPKGLRAFDIEDADFFPTLVPGPRDRDGLPESIRAWKCRIEERDPARTFAVALLYGPSGSGKSSLVKAGLLPRLAAQVKPIYVEASPKGTEASLLAALRREMPELPADCGLDLATAAIRANRSGLTGPKVLLVLDQFEQWLHSHPDESDGELVRALRQCDGSGLQALLLVRDDFWMAITRFMRAVEVPLVEGVNSAAAELFDLQHARRVLAELGRALGQFPEQAGPEEERFLEKAVNELAGPDGRIIPVSLTLLAEMLRHRPWSAATLRELGGFEGIGVTFLEETFSARTAPPAHRVHQSAAQAVLKALLPDASSELKGRWRQVRVLQEASGYADRATDFADLIHILDNELRLVTPVDPSGGDGEGSRPSSSPGETYFQLTHDYLVPPLRQWITRKQRETRRGRAELRLADITALWRDRPEARRLPSLLEWLMILGFTRRTAWSPVERLMMRATTRHHLTRGAAVAGIAVAVTYAAYFFRDRERAEASLKSALKADYHSLPGFFAEISAHRDLLRPTLERLLKNTSAPRQDRDVAELLLYRDRPTLERAAALRSRLEAAGPDEVMAIRDTLAVHPRHAGIDDLRRVLKSESALPGARLRVACALVELEPDSTADWRLLAAPLAEALLAEHRRELPHWLELLGSAAPLLVQPLSEVCRDPGRDPATQTTAAEALAEVLEREQQAESLARVTVEARPEAFRILLRELASQERPGQVLVFLRGVLAERVGDLRDETHQDALADRQAAAAVALAALGEPESLWPLLRHRSDPRVRSLLIERLAEGSLAQRILVERLSLGDVDPIERQALLLAWAETRQPAVAAPIKATVIETARVLYRDDPHPGVHSAAELLLRRWGGPELVARCQQHLRGRKSRADALRWELGPNGHTFVILPAPLEFRMGAPPQEPAHYGEPVLHYRKIDRSLSVSTKEVSVQQIRACDPTHYQDPRYGSELDCVAVQLSWFAAARYCNWLSKQAGIEQSQWCYPERVEPGMVISQEALSRSGFRLPTEAEWEYFCRAGTETSRPYGESPDLLTRYAWTWLNSVNRAMPPGQLLPNEFGLFDVLGNAWEWCQDGPPGHYRKDVTGLPPYPRGTKEHPAPDPGRTEVVDSKSRSQETWRLLRGGAFSYAPDRARSAYRDWQPSGDDREYLGLRVVRTVPPEKGQGVDRPF